LICPKCKFEPDDDAIECPKCGGVFAKYEKYLQARVELARQAKKKPLDGLLWSIPNADNPLYFGGRLLVFIGLLWLGWKYVTSSIGASSYAMNSFLHNINLPFHEAGHVLLSWAGSFLHSLGGSLGQLSMPLICLVVLLVKTRDAFGASVCLCWFGSNFIDLAPYINDARSLTLPLVGGNFGHSSPYGFHDWEFLLTESGLLSYDHGIAKAAHFFGSLCIIVAAVWAACLIIRQYRLLRQ